MNTRNHPVSKRGRNIIFRVKRLNVMNSFYPCFACQRRRLVVLATGIVFINHLHVEISVLGVCQTVQRSRVQSVHRLFGIEYIG